MDILNGISEKEKDKIIEFMAIDIFNPKERQYFFNVFTIEQLIKCYKRKVDGDLYWYINKDSYTVFDNTKSITIEFKDKEGE